MNVSNRVFVQSKFFTIQGKYFTTDECKYMHVMYDMHDPNGSPVEWSYDRSSKCKMRVLHQPLADLSIGCLEVGTSDVRASDIVPSVYDQAKRMEIMA